MAVSVRPRKQTYSAKDFKNFDHTGPGTLAGRYLRRFWQPVYRSQDLNAGRAVPIRIMNEDFTLFRGQGGTTHVLAPRCAHRATQLSTGWVEGDCLRCFYHGWKYDATGQCVEMPAEDPSFPPKVRIPSYPTQEYLGLIFAYLGEGEAPPLPRFPFMENHDPAKAVLCNHVYLKPYNYRNQIENSVDPAHVVYVHHNSEYRGLQGVPEVRAEETDYGLILYATRANGKTRVTQYQMPTILHIKQGSRNPIERQWRDFILWRVPIDDETSQGFDISLVYVEGEDQQRFLEAEENLVQHDVAPELGERALAGLMHVDDVEDLGLAVNVQDYVAQKGQGRIYNRATERLGRSDVGVILLRKLFEREMRALAEGRPLTPWQSMTPAATMGV
jgi:5,5'-dehydrodivanillate O-demethylase